MAMSKVVLGALLQTKMLAVGPPTEGESAQAYQKRCFEAMADAIISHIQADARVTVTLDSTVAFPIAVAVVPATGIGGTTAPGTANGTTNTGTIS